MKKERPEDIAIQSMQKVYQVLAPLDDATRDRVVRSVFELLGIGSPANPPDSPQSGTEMLTKRSEPTTSRTLPDRKVSLIELLQSKQAVTNLQKLVVFAYWRERHENNPRFSRDDLKQYFKMAKESPPKNFDRDFVDVVKKGWIHEDGSESYITSKGLEEVENGFERIRMGKSTRGPKKPQKRTSLKAPRTKRKAAKK
ncbi:MAG: hypothetical protein WBP29_11975 [Candidatus Zixiibacteriota bacterium]